MKKIVNIRVDDNKMVGISFEYDTELIMKVKTIRKRKYIPEKHSLKAQVGSWISTSLSVSKKRLNRKSIFL